jgi:5-methyltetrahydrofolate--homocysteine methyltransferase
MPEDSVMIEDAARRRILVLDGAMGSLIQARLKTSGTVFTGCNDELCLSKPELIGAIHDEYLEAGADIIETCSFNATSVSLAPYGLASRAYDISRAAAALARSAADRYHTPEKPRFVAGSMGPTAKSAGISSDLNNPAARAIGWDELEAAYYENARGLLDGGVDLLVIETIIDTLSAKAAAAALFRLFEEKGREWPVMFSATVNEAGRLLSGQDAAGFCAALEHVKPFSLGFNCSFGAEKLLPHVRALAGIAPCCISVYPNAGFPDKAGTYSETPRAMAAALEESMKEGLVNIVGGCCGSTPAHIAAIAETAARYKPRSPAANVSFSPSMPNSMPNSMSPLDTETLRRFLEDGDFDGAVELFLEEKNDWIIVDVDDAVPDAEKLSVLVRTALFFPDLLRKTFVFRSQRRELIEAALKCMPGKALVQYTGTECDEQELKRMTRRYGALSLRR